MITNPELKQQRNTFVASYIEYKKKLCRYATSRTNNAELGEDLVQLTYLKTWTYLTKGGKINTMEAFLYNVLKSLIIDEYRKRKTLSLDSLMAQGFDVGQDETERLADTIDGQQAAALVSQLPKTYKNVIKLRYLNDLSLGEISDITGETRNTVAVKSHRGLAKLRTIMNKNQNKMPLNRLALTSR